MPPAYVFFLYLIKLITFEDDMKKLIKKKIDNLAKKDHIEKISTIKNLKIKNSLVELAKSYKKK